MQNMFIDRKFNVEFINRVLGLDKDIVALKKLYKTLNYRKYFGTQRFNTGTDYGLGRSRLNLNAMVDGMYRYVTVR